MRAQILRFFIHDEVGGIPHGFSLILFFLTVFAVVGTFKSVASHANASGGLIKSAVSGYCLDDRNNSLASHAVVDAHSCNDTEAQAWQVNGVAIKHGSLCLSVNSHSLVELNACSGSANQVWLKDYSGILNPDSGKCLALPTSKINSQLLLENCTNFANPSIGWTINGPTSCGGSSPGQKIACSAVNEWQRWNSASASHNSLLNQYTAGAPYEEWCADFVSYVYKQAGYPFSGGETNSWDENNANNIKNMGFTIHAPGHYMPKPGDVAYFNYEGGHVEIVVSGGSKPTFIYGNSSKTDPATGNGDMAANTITEDGSVGQLMYYLSPNI